MVQEKLFIQCLTGLEIAGIIAAAGSVGSAGANIVSGINTVKKQKKLMAEQDRIADENYAKQLADQRQLIEEDRQYNSIGAQMSRAREAGVSPLAALGVSSGNSISAQAPSQSGVSIPTNDPSISAYSGASNAFASAESSLRSAILGDMQRKQEEQKLKLAIATFDANVLAAESVAQAEKETVRLISNQADEHKVMTQVLASQEEYYKALANKENTLTPLSAQNLAQDYLNKVLRHDMDEAEYEVYKQTMPTQIAQAAANLAKTLTASELDRAQAFGSIENAKSNRMSAWAAVMGVEEQHRHNVTMEQLQEQHEKNVKELKQLELQIEEGKLDFEKTKYYGNLIFKVAVGAAAATAGFFIAGPVGAAYGAALGLGLNLPGNLPMPSRGKPSTNGGV